MVKVLSMIEQDKQWQKEYDARTLADAEEIRSNASRLKGAKQAAKSMAKETAAKAKAMEKIAQTPKAKVAPKAKAKVVPKAKAKVAPKAKAKSTMKTSSNTKTPYKRK